MAGISGINCDGRQEHVACMLERITHRGDAGSKVIESWGATLGAVWPEPQVVPTSPTLRRFMVFSKVEQRPALDPDAGEIASNLRLWLERAVCRRIDGDVMGSWLSGGLDCSVLAALARLHVQKLHTFAAGQPGAPDLEYARQVTDALDTEHHQVVVTLDELLGVLPDVIYYLESFDALLVQSTVTNYLVGKRAADYAGSVAMRSLPFPLFGARHAHASHRRTALERGRARSLVV
jgi:asparagine synthetase B (glutamine-hydrolysing)